MITRINTIGFETKKGKGYYSAEEKDALMCMDIIQLESLKKHVQDVLSFKRTIAKFKHCKMCFAVNNPWRKTCKMCKSDNLK